MTEAAGVEEQAFRGSYVTDFRTLVDEVVSPTLVANEQLGRGVAPYVTAAVRQYAEAATQLAPS